MIYRVTNIICVPKSNTKIPSDRVFAYALKENPASLHPRSKPKKKGHVSIKVSKTLFDWVSVLPKIFMLDFGQIP